MFEKKFILVLQITFLIIFPYAYAQSELDHQEIEVTLDGNIELDFQTTQSRVDYFTADLRIFPKDTYREDILEFKLKHKPGASVVMKNNIEYTWDDDSKIASFGYDAKVKTWNKIFQIHSDVPISSMVLMKEHIKYVDETELVDINNEIRGKAFEIAGDSTTLYDTVFRLAEWVRTNVKYDLNTLTEEATQKSSWVLENRFGVCDEITNLFISFLRSRNIPVRYVVGIAYSDAVPEGWAPHAWAEVYFQGYGWIPFDVTFGQYGWVDTGHVKLSDSVDAREPSVEYTWRAVKVGLKEKDLKLNTTILKKGDEIFPLVDIKLNPLWNEVKGGSFVPVEVAVKNLQNYYLSTLIFVSNAPGLLGDSTKAILLKPHEEKKLNWILTVPELNGDFIYKSDIEVKDSFGGTERKEIFIGDKFPIYSIDEAQKALNEGLNTTSYKLPEEEFITDISSSDVKSERNKNANSKIGIFESLLIFLGNLF